MKAAAKSRGEKFIVLDRRAWTDQFRERLRCYEKEKTALTELCQNGCIEESLLDLFYAYTFSPAFVFKKRAQGRDRVVKGLDGVAGVLERASYRMQETLNVEMMEGWNLARMLNERAILKMPGGSEQPRSTFPGFAIDMPATLRTYSYQLTWLKQQLQRNLSSRQVQNTVYLAELVAYIEATTRNPPSWTLIAHLINAARPASWPQKDVDPMLLSKNFKSFVRRNKELHQEIRSEMTEFLSACAKVPQGTRPPSLASWKLNRKASSKPRA